jgi:NADPH-dependent glutamate synthase beta subunit-like oxidoreductase/ferredoxin
MSGRSPTLPGTPPESAPCRLACPIDQNVQEYVACMAEGRFDEALAVIRRTNPFPSICGRICPHPCEFECTRAGMDRPVAIRELKRFAADLELQAIESSHPFYPESQNRKIAVIGAGPAGLTAAFNLRVRGYGVTLFEALPLAGGMLALGYPEEVLPRRALAKDIEAILAAGVVLKTEARKTLSAVVREGFDAVLVAAGASRVMVKKSFSQARGLAGFVQPWTWLAQRRGGASSLRGKRVVVDGATPHSIHWAMLAAMDGAGEVTVLSPLPESHLPLEPVFAAMARKLGVRILCLHEAVKPVVRRGRLAALALQKMKVEGEDSRGRPLLEPVAAKNQTLAADICMPAGPRIFSPEGFESLALNAWGLAALDPVTMMADSSGIFAAGSAASGGRSIVESIASGRRAAAGIHAFLSGAGAGESLVENRGADVLFRDYSHVEAGPALNIRRKEPEAAACLSTRTQAMAEARRCLRCGACTECMTCHHFCRWTLGAESRDPGSAVVVRLDRDLPGMKSEDEAFKALAAVSLKAEVDGARCDGCAACEEACPYNVINTVAGPGPLEPGLAVIDKNMCRACGLCMPVCPTRAISFAGLDVQELVSAMARRPGAPVILRCRWSRAPSSENDLDVSCLGLVPPLVFLKALEMGAPHVLAVGCKDACHKRSGFDQAQGRVERLRSVLEMTGLDAARISIVPDSEYGEALERLGRLPAHAPGPAGARGETRGLEPSPHAEIMSLSLMFSRAAVAGRVDLPAADDGVVVFGGCLAAAGQLTAGMDGLGAMDMAAASQDLVRKTGVEPGRMPFPGCCGLPFLDSGDREAFERAAGANLSLLSKQGAHTVVVSCLDCLECFRRGYAEIEGSDAVRFIHLVDFLSEAGVKLERSQPAMPLSLGLLASRPGLKEHEAAKMLLAGLENVTILWSGAAPESVVRAGWRLTGRELRRDLIKTLAGAAAAGIDVLVVDSHHLAFHLGRALAEGSWQSYNVRVRPLEVFLREVLSF